MESMTVTRERVERAGMTAAPAKATGARMRDLTPAQRRAVMFAQQQVIKARAAKKAKEERQAALERMWQQEDFAERTRGHTGRAVEAAPEAKEVSLREAIGHVLRDLTPAQRRAVMFAQQQVIKARAAKKAKEERQAALERMWQQEDFAERTRGHTGRAVEAAPEAKEVSLR